MTGWEGFVAAVDACMPALIFGLLVLCVVGVIRELTKR